MTADDWIKIISAIAAALAVVLGAIGALWTRIHGYQMRVDGRMDQLLELTRSSSEARGRAERPTGPYS